MRAEESELMNSKPDLQKAAEMALEYFVNAYGLEDKEIEIKEALQEALAQLEKPPVKSYCGGKPNYCTPEETFTRGKAFTLDRECWVRGCMAHDDRDGISIIISAEPKREWVGLTDEEKGWCAAPTYEETVTRTEAKLKEKNT